jgi:nucleoside-diphosphate-sugar epimerase
MRVLVIGSSGMVGRKLLARLASDGRISGVPISHLTMFDVNHHDTPIEAPFATHALTGDLSNPHQPVALLADKPDIIFHLAAIVSGEAEQDFDKGYRINLDGTRFLLEAIRAAAYVPRLVFTSSVAVFGSPLPDPIPDEHHLTPLTSYGTQKAICELLISDYSRKGLVDGISLRFPTICVRPGKPNAAASGFFSGIIREPLNGLEAQLPVDDEVRHTHASPRSAVGFLLHAAGLDAQHVGNHRAITMPGVAATVGEQIAALRRIAGEQVANRIVRKPDLFIQQIVSGWPQRFDTRKALRLGFRSEQTFDEIIRYYIDDELGGTFQS